MHEEMIPGHAGCEPPLDELPPSQVIRLLLRRHTTSITFDLRNALCGDGEFFIWTGDPKDEPGCLWIPALIRTSDLHGVVREVMLREHFNMAVAVREMERCHTGLGARTVALNPFAFAEVDHLPIEEQIARYEALTAATGLRWCLWVHSGGKSIHAYLAFTRPLQPNDPFRVGIQKLLIAVLCSDTQIQDAGRLMRLPGWRRDRRHQLVKHLDLEAAYEPQHIHDQLAAYAESLSIIDVELTVRTLALSERLMLKANRDEEGGQRDVADKLREHAALLRERRAAPSEFDVRVARAMLGLTTRVSNQKATNSHHTGSGEKQWLTEMEMASYKGLVRHTTVDAPCCSHRGDRKATVLSHANEFPRVYCHRHSCLFLVGHPVVDTEPMSPAAVRILVTELLSDIDAVDDEKLVPHEPSEFEQALIRGGQWVEKAVFPDADRATPSGTHNDTGGSSITNSENVSPVLYMDLFRSDDAFSAFTPVSPNESADEPGEDPHQHEDRLAGERLQRLGEKLSTNASLLRGQASMKRRILALRDRLIGRSESRPASDGVVVVRSYEGQDKVFATARSVIEDVVRTDVTISHEEDSQGRYRWWRLEANGPTPSLAFGLREAVRRGLVSPARRTRRSPAVREAVSGAEDGFADVPLKGKTG